MARGYLNRPELTAERFIADPFSQKSGARLYKTGDLARYLPGGTIEFLGRLDQQVKLRGFRIELGEIEAVLSQHPAVRQAVVIAREDAPSDKHLVAYVVPREKQTAVVGDLQSHAVKQLPNYMLPSAFVLLEALPLTPHGKVDPRALPAPDSTGIAAKETYVAPTTMVQYQLMQIWEELLDVRPIGIRDDFFDLGGHSLLAVRLVNRIEQVCGKKLPLTTLFAGATIEYLAHALLEEEDVSSRAPLVAVQASGSKRPFFYLHGDWSAGAFYCLKLAHYLGPTQPFYVLEPYRFDGLPMPPTFEAMAAAHLEALRSVQPVGPYLLGGFCNGGLIAYEMARQLHTQGEQVELLVLIDPASPASHCWLRSILRHLSTLLHLGPQQQFAWFLHVLHVYKYLRLAQYRQRWHDLGGDSEPEESQGRSATAGLGLGRLAWLVPSVEAIRRNWLNVYEWVTADYVPGSYPGKIMVFWSSEGSASMQRMGWRQVLRRIGWTKMVEANEVEVQVIPGTHITWRTEHYRTLAEQLQMCLNKAQVATLSQ